MSTSRTIIFGLERRIELTVTGVILVKEVSVIEFAMYAVMEDRSSNSSLNFPVFSEGGGGEGKGQKGQTLFPLPLTHHKICPPLNPKNDQVLRDSLILA